MVSGDIETDSGIELTLTLSDEDKVELAQLLAGDSQDWMLVIDSEYAGMLEFGTSPASGSSSRSAHFFLSPNGKPIFRVTTDTFYKIYQWAKSVPGVKDPYSFAYTVYKTIMENGLAPHPFIRPALNMFEDNFAEIYQEEGSFKECLEVLADMIYDNLDGVGLADKPPKEFTGALKRSISVEPSDGRSDDFGDDSKWDDDLNSAGMQRRAQ